jgi:transcriptional regulator of arginine metabolism
MKAQRQSAILDVVEQEAVRSQEQLRQRLMARGFDVTQATLSRDIKELGLLKRSSDGAYQPAGAAVASPVNALDALGRALADYLLNAEAVQQLVVLKTGTGQAQILAVSLDRARLPEIAGTLAGDDTILIIARDPKGAQAIVKQLKELAS